MTITAPSVPRSDALTRAWLTVALLTFNIVDVVSTRAVLGRGGTELNPIASKLMAGDHLLVAKLFMCVLLGLLSLRVQRRWVTPALAAVTLVYGVVAAGNLVQLALH
jgi:hypothetical protein